MSAEGFPGFAIGSALDKQFEWFLVHNLYQGLITLSTYPFSFQTPEKALL